MPLPIDAEITYRDRDWLRQRYWEEGLSVREIAHLAGIGRAAILRWMRKHDIPRRTLSEAKKGKNNPMWGKRGKRCPNWKGGRTYNSKGYVWIVQPDHPRADDRGYVFEHILVLEERLGRTLRKGEVSHHINGIKDDNGWENLAVFPSTAAHVAYHGRLERIKNGFPSGPIVG